MIRDFLYSIYAIAATNPLGTPEQLRLPNTEAENSVIRDVLYVLLTISGALSIIFIVVGGIMLIAGGGNPEQVKRGRTTILYAVLGLVITILAYAIIFLVTNVVRTGEISS